MIEQKIDQLIAALNANTEALLSSRTVQKPVQVEIPTIPEVVVTPPPPPIPPAPKVTLEDIRTVANKLLEAGKLSVVKQINESFKVKKLSDIDPSNHQAVYDRLKQALET